MNSPYWQVTLSESDGAIHSLRHDPTGEENFDLELIYRPMTIVHQGETIPVQQEHLVFSEDGRTLRIALNLPGALLQWSVDLGPEGFYDRLTRRSIQTPQPESPALHTFISGGKGHYIPIESYKRIDPDRLNRRNLALYLHRNPGRSTLIETADGAFLQVEHANAKGAIFSFKDDRLLVRFELDNQGIAFRPYDATDGIRLEEGQQLPRFTFGNDKTIRNSLGGDITLNELFNDFFLQSAFWFHYGHGLSAWAAWGGQGHAYMDSPYRIDSRNALMSQIIGDDGYGRDGYAWTWGDQVGWPFPRGYDTRHFGINAMHIVGAQAVLQWSGEYDKVSGIDLSVYGYHDDRRVLAQDDISANYQLIRNYPYTQRFELRSPVDRLALKLRVSSVSMHGHDDNLIQQELYPKSHGLPYLPQALAELPGQIAAQRITADDSFNTLGVFTCNWQTPGNKVRLRAFLWSENYENTIAQKPIGEAQVTVPDNAFACLGFDKIYPAGTEILFVMDQPEAADGKEEILAGFWHLPTPEGHTEMFVEGDMMDGRSLYILSGLRLFPEAQVRVLNDQGEPVYDEHHDMKGATEEFSFDVELDPGTYAVEFTSLGSTIRWYGSQGNTSFGGQAAYDGHRWNWLDRCRRAMEYQMDILNAKREKVLLLDGRHGDNDHTGVADVTVGNNYYDILPFGYLDAYANAWFYDSLRAMAELEKAYGDPKKAEYYEAFREKVKDRYNELFWTENGFKDGAARYIGCIDINGDRHDYGFSFVNTLAVTVGLADAERAEAALRWLDEGYALNPEGEKEDIYHFQFGPRTTTIDNPDWWAVHQDYELFPWGDQIQNGGADLYESYYDLQSRLSTRGADDAYDRLMAILSRYAEPDRLTGGTRLYTGESIQGGDTPGAVGVMSYEFPETAMLAGIVVYGFLGADARAEGLRIEPRIPNDQPFIRAENIFYHGTYFDIEAAHDTIKIVARPKEGRYRFEIGGELLTPPFEWEGSYDPDGGVLVKPHQID